MYPAPPVTSVVRRECSATVQHCTVRRVIAAVVVTFSASADVLDRCLRALRDVGGIDRVIVVDTGGRAEIAPDLTELAEVHRIANNGYGAAANRGFQIAGGATWLALLNDDVVVQPGWLTPLVAALDQDGVGAVQPVLVSTDHSRVTSAGVQLDRFGAGSDIDDGASTPAASPPQALAIFNGGTVLLDPAFLSATGGFDERYFLYYEDVDLAMRGAQLGWEFRLVAESTVEHQRGTTTSTLGEQTLFHQERNRLWAAARFAPPGTVMRALGLSIRRLRHEPRSVHRQALVAGVAGMPRRFAERFRAR